MQTNFLVQQFNRLEGALEFPYLKEGDIGIQIGFDMSSKNVSSDLFNMASRVGKTGLAIGIDPDDTNHRKAREWMDKTGIKNVKLIQCGTYKEKTTLRFQLAKRSSHNVLSEYDSLEQSESEVSIEVDTLDNVLARHEIDIQRVRHINVTNNTAEYHTLLGMSNLLDEAKNITITLTCGRTIRNKGLVDGKPDEQLIMAKLREHGYWCKFYRIRDLFWWGFFKKLLVKREWVYDGNPRFGVVIANKGNQPLRWNHSYL